MSSLSRISNNLASSTFMRNTGSRVRMGSPFIQQRDLFTKRVAACDRVAVFTLGKLTSVKGLGLRDANLIDPPIKPYNIYSLPYFQDTIHIDMSIHEKFPHWTFTIKNKHEPNDLKVRVAAHVQYAFVDVEKAIGNCRGVRESRQRISKLKDLVMSEAKIVTQEKLTDCSGIKQLLREGEDVLVREANVFLEKSGIQLRSVRIFCEAMENIIYTPITKAEK